MEKYHIAVLDIGKTNKKILIYDQDLLIKTERFTRISEIEDGEILLDDINTLKSWILSTLSELSQQYDIRVIATSAHGATYGLVDHKGNQVVPQIAYNTDPNDELHHEFYELCGDPIELQKATASPNFNLLINPAKGIFFTKQRYPEQFSRAKKLLMYPQLFGYWLTGIACADPTYVGNHTYLWNFGKKDWSEVVDKLEIRPLLPKVFKNPWESLGTIKQEIADATGLLSNVIVTVGIHDSNASLLPYMVSMDKPFLLNSTGTWCVIMNEKDEVLFKDDELGKVVFYNLNAFWKPVKTAIFLGGMEFEHYSGIIQKIHNRTDIPGFNQEIYQQIIDNCAEFILPSVAKGIGQFPDSVPRVVDNESVYSLDDLETGNVIPSFFQDYEKAFAVLNLSLAIQTKVSFDRADMTKGMQVFTEGGFSKNESYNTLMTSFYPDSSFYLTSLKEASAFGAAMTGKAAFENIDISSLRSNISINTKVVPTNCLEKIYKYFEKFISFI